MMGILIEPGCANALYQGIETCLKEIETGTKMKKNARNYAREFLSKESILLRFENFLEENKN